MGLERLQDISADGLLLGELGAVGEGLIESRQWKRIRFQFLEQILQNSCLPEPRDPDKISQELFNQARHWTKQWFWRPMDPHPRHEFLIPSLEGKRFHDYIYEDNFAKWKTLGLKHWPEDVVCFANAKVQSTSDPPFFAPPAPPESVMRRIVFLELWAGIGSLSEVFNSVFDVVAGASVEIHPYSRAVLKRHLSDHLQIFVDVRTFDVKIWLQEFQQRHDIFSVIIAAGHSCQGHVHSNGDGWFGRRS